MRNILKKRSAVWLLYSGFAVSVIFIVSGIGYYVISRDYQRFETEARHLREEYVAGQQQQIKSEVERVVDFIQYNWANAEERLRNNLKDRTYEAFAVATNLYQVNQGRASEQEIRNTILGALRPINFNHGRGYYFATGLDGVEILFADHPELEGQSMLDIRDTRGAFVIRDMIELVRRDGEGFYQYTWTKPNAQGVNFRKIAFVKYFAPFDFLIGTGEYLDDMEQDIQQEVLDRIGKIRFGKEGYVFVVNYDGVTVMNGTQPELIGKNMWDMTDPNGVKVIQEERIAAETAEGDFIRYHWEKPSTKGIRPKISFVKGFPQWRWMVGAGVYTDEIEPVITAMDAAAKKGMRKDLYRLGFTLAVVLVIALSICFRLSHYFKRQLDLFLHFFKDAKSGGKRIDVDQIFSREFQILGDSANRMLVEWEKAAEGLRESEVKYRALVETTGTGYVIVDSEGTVLDANKEYVRLTGHRVLEEIRGRRVTEWTAPYDLARNAEEIKKCEEQGSVHNLEIDYKDNGGKCTSIEINATVLTTSEGMKILTLCRDITERKMAERALEESEAKFRSYIESAPMAIFVADRQGRLIDFNPAAIDLLGYDAATLRDMNIMDLHPQEDSEEVRSVFATLLALGHVETERRMKKRNEQLIWVSLRAVMTPDQLSFAYCQDISERKQMEEDRSRVEVQLRQAQKMESVGRLAGGVAHDFNNMLGIILGHAEMALDRMDPAQPLFTNLQEIRKAAERSANLTRQLLAFARKQTVAPKVLDLNETIEGILKMLRRLIGEDIDLAWRPGAGVWQVKVDPSQIDQILANLCVNARDAIAGVGKLTIETKNVTFDDGNCAGHVGYVPGEYVMLAVSDDGCGIDKETQDRLFEPFFTTKGVGEGTGLGLATVYGVVKQNNGFIDVFSQVDQGTTFKVYLPRHKGKSEQMLKEGSPKPAGRGHETILLVEDEPAILSMTTMMLECQGYTVLAAGTPREAIRLARACPGEIHLVMTDVVMPEMNGRDLAKNLLALYPNLRHLFMSGYTANVIAHHGVLDAGVNFIQKPFSMQGLAAKLREVLAVDDE